MSKCNRNIKQEEIEALERVLKQDSANDYLTDEQLRQKAVNVLTEKLYERMGDEVDAMIDSIRLPVRRLVWDGSKWKDTGSVVIGHKVEVLDNGGYRLTYETSKKGEVKPVVVDENGVVDSGDGKKGKSKYNIGDLNDLVDKRDKLEYEALMSDKEAEIEGDYIRQAELVQDPTKAVELAKRLMENDDVEISQEHADRLLTLTETLTDSMKSFIPEMHVYLNEKASRNGGVIVLEGENAGMYINKSDKAGTSNLSSTEAYVHELVHAATSYAIRQNGARVAGTMQRLKAMRSQVMKELTAEDLMPDVYTDEKIAEEKAQETIDYMNENLEEFLAVAMTNDKVYSKLKDMNAYRSKPEEFKSIWDQMLYYLGALADRVFMVVRKEHKNVKNDALLEKLMLQLAENNNRAIEVSKQGWISKLFDKRDELDDYASSMLDKLEELAKKGKIRSVPQNMTKVQEAMWLARDMWKFLANPETRDVFEWMLSTHGMPKEGTVQTFIRALRDSDSLQLVVEKMGLLSNQIDKRREDKAVDVAGMLMRTFDKKPTKDELSAITRAGFDVELSTVYDDYSKDEMVRILRDESAAYKEVEKLRKEVRALAKNEKYANYYEAQARGLGSYMVSGMAGLNQVYNAESIAKLKGTGLEVEASAELVEAIDKLATMEGVISTDQSMKNKLSEVIEKEPNAVKNMMAYHKSFVRQSKEKLFDGDKEAHRIKGYSKEIFDDTITVKVAPVRDKKKLEKEGFTVRKVLKKANGDRSRTEMALYVNRHHMRQSFNQHNMRITDLNRKGTSLLSSYGQENHELKWKDATNNVLELKIKAQQMTNKMFEGKFDPMENSDVSLSPVYNQEGEIVDYRYMMPKAEKELLLNQDTNAALVLGRSIASIYDKVESAKFNRELVGIIREDMALNYEDDTNVGKNGKEYIRIDKDSKTKDVREVWTVLPKEVKKDIEINGEIAVRRDLLYAYFGFRDPSLADTFAFKYTPKMVKEAVRFAEMWWKEVVSIHKVDIIIRTPAVLIGNVVSNIMIPIMAGHNPKDVMKYQWDGYREIKQFQKNTHELIRLQEKVEAGKASKSDESRIKQLEDELELSPAKKLIDEGLFQAIIEDASVEDIRTTNRLTTKRDEMLEKYGAPEWVKTGADVLWLTDKTKYFKMMSTATQYSDFVARYAQYNLTIERQQRRFVKDNRRKPTRAELKKMEDDAVVLVKDAYINYDLPSSKWTQYANDMGLVMFTKYFERIQRVIRTTGKDKPVSTLMTLLGQVYLTGDIDDITDQSIFTKNYSGMFHLDPFEHLGAVVTPTLGEYLYDVYKMAN